MNPTDQPRNGDDRVTFDWWANGNHHRAYNVSRRLHANMVKWSDTHAKTIDLIVGAVDERFTRPATER